MKAHRLAQLLLAGPDDEVLLMPDEHEGHLPHIVEGVLGSAPFRFEFDGEKQVVVLGVYSNSGQFLDNDQDE